MIEGDRVVMNVSDNGVGPPTDVDVMRGGHGLKYLAARAAAFGGDCRLALRYAPGGEVRVGGAMLHWSAPF